MNKRFLYIAGIAITLLRFAVGGVYHSYLLVGWGFWTLVEIGGSFWDRSGWKGLLLLFPLSAAVFAVGGHAFSIGFLHFLSGDPGEKFLSPLIPVFFCFSLFVWEGWIYRYFPAPEGGEKRKRVKEVVLLVVGLVCFFFLVTGALLKGYWGAADSAGGLLFCVSTLSRFLPPLIERTGALLPSFSGE